LGTGAGGQKAKMMEAGATGPRKKFNDIFSHLDTIGLHKRDGPPDTGHAKKTQSVKGNPRSGERAKSAAQFPFTHNIKDNRSLLTCR